MPRSISGYSRPALRRPAGAWPPRSLWDWLGARGDPAPWHARLDAAYRESQRHYHTLQHLEECLNEFDGIRSLVGNPVAVEAALWFHDAVYDPRSSVNEERSAALAVECLSGAGVEGRTVDLVGRLVLCTKSHEPGEIPDAPFLLDVDLAILGQPPSRFWQYEAAIRAEYAWVPADTFARKRGEILESFLERKTIYVTPFFRDRYEARSLENLRAAIARLGQPPLE